MWSETCLINNWNLTDAFGCYVSFKLFSGKSTFCFISCGFCSELLHNIKKLKVHVTSNGCRLLVWFFSTVLWVVIHSNSQLIILLYINTFYNSFKYLRGKVSFECKKKKPTPEHKKKANSLTKGTSFKPGVKRVWRYQRGNQNP